MSFFASGGGQNFFAGPCPTPSRASARGTWGSKTAARSIKKQDIRWCRVSFFASGAGKTFLRPPGRRPAGHQLGDRGGLRPPRALYRNKTSGVAGCLFLRLGTGKTFLRPQRGRRDLAPPLGAATSRWDVAQRPVSAAASVGAGRLPLADSTRGSSRDAGTAPAVTERAPPQTKRHPANPGCPSFFLGSLRRFTPLPRSSRRCPPPCRFGCR